MEMLICEIIIIFFAALCFMLSGSEIAVVSSNNLKFKALAKRRLYRAKTAIYLQNNIENTLACILIANAMAYIAVISLTVYAAFKIFTIAPHNFILIMFVEFAGLLIICETLPRSIAQNTPNRYLLFFSVPIYYICKIITPIERFFFYFSKMFTGKILNLKTSEYLPSINIIKHDYDKETIADEDQQMFVDEILSFHSLAADEIMTPSIDIVSIEKKQSIKDLVKIIEQTRFSRIPVYEDRVDNIIGYVCFKDILQNKKAKKIDDVIKKAYYVPATKKINSLFNEMQEQNLHVAFVVNEYGGVDGLITFEDIAEEIVGEIQSLDHSEDELIKQIDDKYLIDGSLDIEFFQREFNIHIEKKGFETIAGFVLYKFGRIPRKGDEFEYNGYIFTVNKATDRSVEKIMLSKKIL